MSILSDVRVVLNDTGVFWADTQVLEAINFAQLDVASQTKLVLGTVTLSVTAGDDIVEIDSTLFIPQRIHNGTLTTYPTTMRELENFNRLWKSTTAGQPEHFVLWDWNHIRLFPRPDQNYTFSIEGLLKPTEVTTTTVMFGVGKYNSAIRYYTLAYLLEATRPDLAAWYIQLGDKDVMELNKTLRNQQSHNIRRFRPAKRVNLKNSGMISNNSLYNNFNSYDGL
mgnify:CR=1 FL=1